MFICLRSCDDIHCGLHVCLVDAEESDVVRSWASGEVSKILGYEDEIVTGLLFDLLEGQRFVCIAKRNHPLSCRPSVWMSC